MKKFGILGVIVAVVTMLVMPMPVMAKGPTGDTVEVSWYEDAVRYNPDGSVASSWTDDPLGPATLVQTGKAYHFADIQEYYNRELENLSGKLVISGSGKLSGHATYTSPFSGLPIRDRFHGEVTIDAEAGTMVGTYTQWSYAFGTEEEVLNWYPNAVPDDEDCCWFIGYTEYTAHK